MLEKKRSYAPLLKVSDETPSGTIPSLVYHKTCRSMFTLKRDLQQSTSNEKTRSSNRGEGSQILPKKCIFCNKDKYLSGKRTRERLVSCQTFQADEKIRNIAKEKNDQRILAIAADELIAREASYHKSCYNSHTAVLYKEDIVQKETVSDIAFNIIKENLSELYKIPI